MTVDQAQGSESDIVILSCVRSNHNRNIGFVSNPNRLNVAVSRARERIVVIGSTNTLASDSKWAKLIGMCKTIGSVEALPAAVSGSNAMPQRPENAWKKWKSQCEEQLQQLSALRATRSVIDRFK